MNDQQINEEERFMQLLMQQYYSNQAQEQWEQN